MVLICCPPIHSSSQTLRWRRAPQALEIAAGRFNHGPCQAERSKSAHRARVDDDMDDGGGDDVGGPVDDPVDGRVNDDVDNHGDPVGFRSSMDDVMQDPALR